MKCLHANGRCSQCGLPLAVVERRECTAPPRLGDWAAKLLETVGITQDRYKAVKALFGLPPTCDCPARQEWLNRVSDWWRGLRRG